MSAVLNATAFNAGLDRAEERFQRMFKERVRRLVHTGMRSLIAKTPVNTGEAIMNYVASSGTPSGSHRRAGKAVEATNKLALGAEKLRGPAAAISFATLATVSFDDPYKVYWITNNTPHIGGLEHGLLPEAPYVPRSPAGMFAVTIQELMQLLGSGTL